MAPLPFLDHEGPLAFAHRGGAGEHPENTMPAFEAAVDLGYRYLETDVHLTSDGVVVAFHDDQLDRVTDRVGAIAVLPWREVAAARVDGREPIPRFDELLAAFPDVMVNVDAKSDAVVEELMATIRRVGALDRVCVAAFSDERIRRLATGLGPRLCHSLGPSAVARLRIASFGAPVGRIRGHCVQVPTTSRGRTLVDARFVAAAHRRGLPVHVWTVDDPAEMKRLLDLGIDGIMTDRPRVLKQVLTERGQWAAA